MTHPEQNMSCDAVSERLIDLVYDEIDPGEIEMVRAHVEGCESCDRSYRRLVDGRRMARSIPLHEPPPPAIQAVLAAAHARAAEIRSQQRAVPGVVPQVETRAAPPEASSEGWSSFFRRLGELAMGPQVAMATTLMVVIGLGLWSLPRLDDRHETMTENALVEPEAPRAAERAAGLEPAERLDLEMDPRTRRIVAREDEAEADLEPAHRVMRRPMARGEASNSNGAAFDDLAEPRAEPAHAPSSSGLGGSSVEGSRQAGGTQRATGRSGGAGAGPSGGTQRNVRTRRARERAPRPSADEALARPASPAPSRSRRRVARRQARPEASSGSASSSGSGVDRGALAEEQDESAVESMSSRASDRASEDALAPPAPADVSDALARGLHRRARAALDDRRWLQCATLYQSLVRRYRGYPELARAYSELAHCERQRGRTAEAAAALRQAQQYARPQPRRRSMDSDELPMESESVRSGLAY